MKISYKSYPKLNMPALESHSFYEIYFLVKGNRKIFLNDQSHLATPNSIFFITPRTLHKTIGDEPCERINLYLSEDCISESNLQFLKKNANMHILLSPQTASLIQTILIKGAKATAQDTQTIGHIANCVLFLLQSNNVIECAQKKTGNQTLQPIIQYINEHFAQPLTIEGLSARFFISKSSLFRLFRQELQCTVVEYLLALRLHCAKHLLTTTSQNMQQIAVHCGFHSANYFSLLFKQKVGISPSQFRKTQHLDY